MRPPSTLNLTLLCLNVVLTFFLMSALLFSRSGLGTTSAAHLLPDNMAALGMDVYYEKGPFVLLAGKDFPRTRSFILGQRDRPLFMSALDDVGMGGPVVNSASVDLLPDFSLSCEYSLADNVAHVEQLTLSHRKEGLIETLTDLNADGVFDVRQTRDEERHLSHVYVLYQGAWREVDKGPKQDQFHKQLLDGTRVSFDAECGQWLSAMEEPATSSDEGMHEDKQETPASR